MAQATRKRRRSWVPRAINASVGSALDHDADIRLLADEMTEWQENLEGANMEHLPKYDEVMETAETLSEAADSIEGAAATIRELIEEGAIDDSATVSVSEITPYGRKAPPRWMQLSNALSALQSVVDHLEGIGIDDADDEDATVREAADELASAISELEGVDFPSMY